MTKRNRLGLLIVTVGGVSSAAWAYVGIQSVRALFESGGGVFASGGLPDLFRYVLPLVANAWLARQACRCGRTGRLLRRAHQAVTLALIMPVVLVLGALLSGAFTHGVTGIWQQLTTSVFFVGALWFPVQALFASGLLGLLVSSGGSQVEKLPA